MFPCHCRCDFAQTNELSVALLQHPRMTVTTAAKQSANTRDCLGFPYVAERRSGRHLPPSSCRNPARDEPNAQTLEKCREMATVNIDYLDRAELVTPWEFAPIAPEASGAGKLRTVEEVSGRREIRRFAPVAFRSRSPCRTRPLSSGRTPRRVRE